MILFAYRFMFDFRLFIIKMPIKIKTVFIIIVLITSFFLTFSYANSVEEDNNNLTLVYISDLNLAPTPFVDQREKHALEALDGLLVYESQVIFQDIVKYLNQKLEPDLVVFGGNNVLTGLNNKNQQGVDEGIWNLFLDMASEIKAVFLIVLGQNEIKSQSKTSIAQMLKSFGQEVTNTWWLYKIKNYLV